MNIRPGRRQPTVVPGDPSQHLLRRVLCVDRPERFIARLVLHEEDAWAIALVDSGTGSGTTSRERYTALHILWARDEDTAAISVEGHGALPVAPGDTVALAPGTAWRYGSGLLVCEVQAPQGSPCPGTHVVGPTHGIERFDGLNRQTLCAIMPGLTLERWKITQPLSLPAGAAIVNLVDPLALVWSGGTDLIGRGELRVLPSGLDRITLLPDGLGYALVVRTSPDIDGLRHALSPSEFAEISCWGERRMGDDG